MRQASVWWLLPSIALGTIAITLLSPIMPSLKTSWFKGTCNTELDPNCTLKRAQQVSGIISSVRYLVIFFVSAFLGRLSDRIVRKPLLRISNVGSLLPVLALYFTNGESALAYYAAFVMSGFVTSGSFQIVAYVADCTPVEDRARHFGYLGAVSGLAFIATPLVSAFASSISYSTLFLASATIIMLLQ
jgi:MFS family permease